MSDFLPDAPTAENRDRVVFTVTVDLPKSNGFSSWDEMKRVVDLIHRDLRQECGRMHPEVSMMASESS
jgi:hypothetical protein